MLRIARQRHPNGGLLLIFSDITNEVSLKSQYDALLQTQKAALDSALVTLLKNIQQSPDSARAGRMVDLLFAHLEQCNAEARDESRNTHQDRTRRMMDAYRPTPRQKNE